MLEDENVVGPNSELSAGADALMSAHVRGFGSGATAIVSSVVPDLSGIPDEMRELPNWLVWKPVQDKNGGKARKVPYYVNGSLRGEGLKLDSAEDVARLASFEEATAAFATRPNVYAGVGFAVVAGCGVGGLDLDDCLDADGNFTNNNAKQIFDVAVESGCYAEVSPSGRGVRILGSSVDFQAYKPACGGFEAYSQKRYLTVTGNVLANPKGFGDIGPALALMKHLIGAPQDKSASTDRSSRHVVDISVGYIKPDSVDEGGRSNAMMAYAGHLRGRRTPEDVILESALDFNLAKFNPPLPIDEVMKCVDQYAHQAQTPIQPSDDPADWGEPKPIEQGLPPVPPFDLNVLPDIFRPFVEDAAELMQAPPEYIAVPLMIAAAATIGNGYSIAPKARDVSWLVSPVIWGGCVGRPGVKKSPSMDKAFNFVKPLEDDMVADHQARLQKYHIDKINYDAILAQAKKAAVGGAPMPTLPPEPQRPEPERLIVNDSTYQKLADLLQWSPRGVLVERDELVGLLETLESQGQEGARAFYLQAWNGNSTYRSDRIGRGSFVVKRLALWVVGGIQPGKLQSYVRQAVIGGNGADGLLQRFQLLVWPDNQGDWKNIDRHPDMAAYDAVQTTFKKLRALDSIAIGAKNNLGGGPAYLHFTKAAQQLYDQFRSHLEHICRKQDMHEAMEDHLAKYPSLLAALALIIHLVDGGTGPVKLISLRKAMGWIQYLIPHAERAYSAATNNGALSAKALADKITVGSLTTGFSARMVERKQWSQLTRQEDVKAAIEWLVDADWLVEVTTPTGGRSKLTYTVNPRVRMAL